MFLIKKFRLFLTKYVSLIDPLSKCLLLFASPSTSGSRQSSDGQHGRLTDTNSQPSKLKIHASFVAHFRTAVRPEIVTELFTSNPRFRNGFRPDEQCNVRMSVKTCQQECGIFCSHPSCVLEEFMCVFKELPAKKRFWSGYLNEVFFTFHDKKDDA